MDAIWSFIRSLDWVIPIITFSISLPIFWSCWMFWREEVYKSSRKLLPWVFLEIRVPREVLKGPKAMEQFFAALRPLANQPSSWIKKYIEGEVPRWHIIDLVGVNNEVRFFMRVSYRLQGAIEGLLYSNYPELEIVQCEDPFPSILPATYDELDAQGYDIYGQELYLAKSPAVSIRTYSEFEQETGDEKGRIIDPFSVFLELVGNLKPREMILAQFVLMPDIHKEHWTHDAKHILEQLRNTTQELGKDKDGNPQYRFRFRTPAEETIIKRIEDKLERGTFETTIRCIYIAPKEEYNANIGYRGVMTFFNQFRHDTQSMERNIEIMTKTDWFYYPWIFPARRLYGKKQVYYREYMDRFLPEETWAGRFYNSTFWKWCIHHKPMALSVEELATLVHIPTNVILTSHSIDRIESKRLSAPQNLPQ